jgi:hypothetical protein
MNTHNHILTQLVDEWLGTLRQESAVRAAVSSGPPRETSRPGRRRRRSARALVLRVRGVAR